MGIGIYALIYEPIFHASRSAFVGAVNLFGVSAGGLAGGKLVAGVLSILLPTFLMGGTLPVLSRHMIRSLASVGPLISRLYFLNSLGAVVGCLLAGFFLIRSLRLHFSIVAGAALNISAGLLALLLARTSKPQASTAQELSPVRDANTDPSMTRVTLTLVLLCVAVSGGVVPGVGMPATGEQSSLFGNEHSDGHALVRSRPCTGTDPGGGNLFR